MSDITKSEIGYLANADHHHHQWTKCPVARASGVLSSKARQIWQKQGLLFLTTCNETEEVNDWFSLAVDAILRVFIRPLANSFFMVYRNSLQAVPYPPELYGSRVILQLLFVKRILRQQSKSAPIMPVDEVSFLLDSFLPHTSPNATSYWFVTAENDGTSSSATNNHFTTSPIRTKSRKRITLLKWIMHMQQSTQSFRPYMSN